MANTNETFDAQSDRSISKGSLAQYSFVELDTKLGPSSELGRGASGVVRLVEQRETRKQFAMKIVESAELDPDSACHEDPQLREHQE